MDIIVDMYVSGYVIGMLNKKTLRHICKIIKPNRVFINEQTMRATIYCEMRELHKNSKLTKNFTSFRKYVEINNISDSLFN